MFRFSQNTVGIIADSSASNSYDSQEHNKHYEDISFHNNNHGMILILSTAKLLSTARQGEAAVSKSAELFPPYSLQRQQSHAFSLLPILQC